MSELQCSNALRNRGMTYPRTCRECALGPCKYGHNDKLPNGPVSRVVFNATDIEEAVSAVARKINMDCLNRDVMNLTVVPVMVGALLFTADLVRHIVPFQLKIKVAPVTISSYHQDQPGELRIGELPLVVGEHVLIVDDICDSARTLTMLRSILLTMGAKSVKTAVLLDKMKTQFKPDYVGLTCPDVYVYGYGLDAMGLHRNLPYIVEDWK